MRCNQESCSLIQGIDNLLIGNFNVADLYTKGLCLNHLQQIINDPAFRAGQILAGGLCTVSWWNFDPKLQSLLTAEFAPLQGSRISELTCNWDIVIGLTPEQS